MIFSASRSFVLRGAPKRAPLFSLSHGREEYRVFFVKTLTMSERSGKIRVVKGKLGVAQLVARYLGVVEAAGSSPVTQTKMSHFLVYID